MDLLMTGCAICCQSLMWQGTHASSWCSMNPLDMHNPCITACRVAVNTHSKLQTPVVLHGPW